MFISRFLCVFGVFLLSGFVFTGDVVSQTAGETFHNISALSQMPAEEMGKVMNLMSASLGVQCSHCHQGNQFEIEHVGHKDAAREMLEMTLAMNRQYFGGRPVVNCNTCHRGQPVPDSALPLDMPAQTLLSKRSASPLSPGLTKQQTTDVPKSDSQSTATIEPAALLKKHFEITRLNPASQPDQTLHLVAKRIEPAGPSEDEELWIASTGASRMETHYGSTVITETIDGKSAWKSIKDRLLTLKDDEAEQIVREAQLASGRLSSEAFESWQYEGLAQVRDTDAHVVTATTTRKLSERFYFDVKTGLLLRRVCAVPTILGDFEYQVDYRDYSEAAGLLLPMRIEFQVPNIAWTREVQTVEWLQGVDAAKYARP